MILEMIRRVAIASNVVIDLFFLEITHLCGSGGHLRAHNVSNCLGVVITLVDLLRGIRVVEQFVG